MVNGKLRQIVLMCFEIRCDICIEVNDFNDALFLVGASKDCAGLIGTQRTEAFGVFERVDGFDQFQVTEVVNVYSFLENNDHPILVKPNRESSDHLLVFPQSHGLDRGLEAEFADALELVVVPEEHFIERELGMVAAADEGQYITSEEHFDYADAAVEVYGVRDSFGLTAVDGVFERQRVVDLEALLRAAREATLALVESDV